MAEHQLWHMFVTQLGPEDSRVTNVMVAEIDCGNWVIFGQFWRLTVDDECIQT